MSKKRVVFAIFVCVIGIFIAEWIEDPALKPYGVFIGIDPNETAKLKGFERLIIDASEFSKGEVQVMKEYSHEVYTYLNVGSLETYRPYYSRFKSITLGVYDNWPDEQWVDVSQKQWQDFIVNEIASDFVKMGVDGFFIDNVDVYYVYHTPEMYNGLKHILRALSEKYGLKVIVNGGDTFVSEAVLESDFQSLGIDAVNQETVFSSIDFDTKTFGSQSSKEKEYFLNYLDTVKNAGLNVFLLEYVDNDEGLIKSIDDYCRKKGFIYYIARNLNLD